MKRIAALFLVIAVAFLIQCGNSFTPQAQNAGTAATITVGTTTTGAPGTPASVTNVGTSAAAVLNFTIPQGAAGSFLSPLVAQNLGGFTPTNYNDVLENLGGPAVTATINEAQLVSLTISAYISASDASCEASVHGQAEANIGASYFSGTFQNTYFFIANPGTYQWQIWYEGYYPTGQSPTGSCSFQGSQIVFQSYGAGSLT